MSLLCADIYCQCIDRCRQWVVNCRTVGLDNKSTEQLHKNFLVCADHFADSMFMNCMERNKLVHNAVPTIFKFPSKASGTATKRKPPRDRSAEPVVKKARRSSEASVGQVEYRIENEDQNVSSEAVEQHSSSLRSNTSPSNEVWTPRKVALTSKLKYAYSSLARARVALYRCRKSNASTALLGYGKKAAQCCTFCEDFSRLSQCQQQFVNSQIKSTKFTKFGMRFTKHDKLLALGLYYRSPSAYRFMSQSFRMPGVKTLQTFIGGLHLGCGFKSQYFEALAKRVESMGDKEKLCVLTFDGMALKSKLQYSEAHDKINGFVDLGEFGKGTSDVAKQALQFMVRGLSTKWKQPLGHFFGSYAVKAEVLQQMLTSAVSLLEKTGLQVVAVVCDQEISHRLMFKCLGASVSQPWFMSANNNKVFVMYDVPHLVKNLRNNLLNHDIIINDQTVSFKHLQRLYELDKQSSLRLCPKLTDGHFNLKPFKKMKVSLATQVLSHSVSSALKTYVRFNQIDQSALVTADFVERIDQVFDILNSRCQIDHKWKKPLTVRSHDQFTMLDEAVDWVSSWKFRHVLTKKDKRLPFHEGLILTIRSIRMASSFLLTDKCFKYVMTSRFNQDIVENWFSCIRQKGLNNDSRTVWEYESSGKAIMVNWMLTSVSRNSNCEVDFDYFIGVLSKIKTEGAEASVASGYEVERHSPRITTQKTSDKWTSNAKIDSSSEILSSNVQEVQARLTCTGEVATPTLDLTECELIGAATDWTQLFKLDATDDSVVCYLAGYAMKKVSSLVNCSACRAAYKSSSDRSQGDLYNCDSSRLYFIQAKTYEWAKHGLLAPSEELYQLCACFEKVVQMNLEKLICGRNVKSNLKDCFAASVDQHSFSLDFACDEHQQYLRDSVIDLLARVRIHHFVRIRNRELLELEQHRKLKVNRKAKKVLHH